MKKNPAPRRGKALVVPLAAFKRDYSKSIETVVKLLRARVHRLAPRTGAVEEVRIIEAELRTALHQVLQEHAYEPKNGAPFEYKRK